MAINHNDRIIVPHIKQIDKEFWPLEVDHTTNPEAVLVYFPRSPMIDPEPDPAADGPVARACRRIAEAYPHRYVILCGWGEEARHSWPETRRVLLGLGARFKIGVPEHKRDEFERLYGG